MITPGQVSVGTATTLVGTVPPGVCNITLIGGPLISYIGAGTATTTNGMPLPPNAVVNIAGYPGSKGVTLYGIGTAATVIGFAVSTGM